MQKAPIVCRNLLRKRAVYFLKAGSISKQIGEFEKRAQPNTFRERRRRFHGQVRGECGGRDESDIKVKYSTTFAQDGRNLVKGSNPKRWTTLSICSLNPKP